MAVLSIPFMEWDLLLLVICVSMVHFIVDSVKYGVTKGKKDNWIVLIWEFFDTIGLPEIMLCKWILGMLIIHKPANILIQKFMQKYKQRMVSDYLEIKKDNNIGRVIGTSVGVVIFTAVLLFGIK